MRKMQWKSWIGLGVATLVLSAGLAATGHAREESDGTPWLGVYTQSLSDELRDGLDYKGESGVLVNRVVSGSPADKAGVRKGDIIVSLNSRSVDSSGELADIVQSATPGQKVALKIIRDGDSKSISVELGTRPESENDFDFETPDTPEMPKMPRTPKAPRMPRDHDGGMHMEHFDVPDAPDAPGALRMFDGMNLGRGRLGVRVETLSPELGEYFDAPGGKGVLVMEVIKGTPAERAGLKAGDVITHVGKRAVYDADDLRNALSDEQGKVELTVTRKGTRHTIDAELDRAPRAMRFDGGGNGREVIRLRDPRVRESIRRSVDREDRGDRDQIRRDIEDLRRQIDALQHELDRDRDRN